MSYSDMLTCACSLDPTGEAPHEEGCPIYERQVAEGEAAEAQERQAGGDAPRERRAAARAAPVEAAPKSRRIGRIHDHDTARKEIEGMARLAKDDPRLSPCAAFAYGHLANRGYRHGSVFVMAGREWLSRWSDGRFTEKECRTALRQLERIGYIARVPWSRVQKKDPGLYAYAKQRYGGKGGRWANVYILRQDFPELDVVSDEENPILELMGLSA